jgi:hypothetical protein
MVYGKTAHNGSVYASPPVGGSQTAGTINSILVGTGIVVALLCIPMMISKTLLEAGRRHLQNGGTPPAA